MVKGIYVGEEAAKYIRVIDPALYAYHAFPQLPQHGQITSNPCEQVNFGLFPPPLFLGLFSIQIDAPFKILMELWFYVQID